MRSPLSHHAARGGPLHGRFVTRRERPRTLGTNHSAPRPTSTPMQPLDTHGLLAIPESEYPRRRHVLAGVTTDCSVLDSGALGERSGAQSGSLDEVGSRPCRRKGPQNAERLIGRHPDDPVAPKVDHPLAGIRCTRTSCRRSAPKPPGGGDSDAAPAPHGRMNSSRSIAIPTPTPTKPSFRP